MSQELFSANLTQFMKNVRIISDPEGFDLYQLVSNNGEYNRKMPYNREDLGNRSGYKENILLLGDLVDSSIPFGATALADNKHYNIRNLMAANKENIRVLLGNRDLNKIKCVPLLNIEEKTDWYNEEISEEVSDGFPLLNIAKNLLSKLEKKEWKWKIPTLKHWAPFWRGVKAELKHFSEPTETCFKRFNRIFGVDSDDGTMGAQNLLTEIPKELVEMDLIPDREYNEELKAALVLVVFKRLLVNFGQSVKQSEIDFDGALYNLFTGNNSFYCAYSEIGNDLALYSHGGMRPKFFEGTENNKDIVISAWKDHITNNKKYYNNSSLSKLVSFFERAQQSGGYYKKDVTTTFSKEEMKDAISYFNRTLKGKLKTLLEREELMVEFESKPSEEMLLQLLITSNQPYAENDFNPRKVGPIMPGIGNIRDVPYVCSSSESCNIYQFVGHSPIGLAPIIDLYENNDGNAKQYLINSDISNTFMGHSDVADTSDVDGHNYSYLEVSTTDKINISINTFVKLNKTNEKGQKFKSQLNLTNDHIKINGFQIIKGGHFDDTTSKIIKNDKLHKWSFSGKLDENTNKYLLTRMLNFVVNSIYHDGEEYIYHPRLINSDGGGSRKLRRTKRKPLRNGKKNSKKSSRVIKKISRKRKRR